MRAGDAGGQGAYRAGGGGDHEHVDAEPFTVHAPGIADSPAAVDHVADRDAVDDLPFVVFALGAALTEDAPDITGADLMAGDGDLEVEGMGRGETGGEVDDDFVNGLSGHLLGGVDGVHDRCLRRFHIDDGAGAHAVRDLVANPDDTQIALFIRPRDEAAHLGAADIERRDQSVLCLGQNFPHSISSFDRRRHRGHRGPGRREPIR